MDNGGKRKGAGRPKGSTNANIFRLADHFTDEERAEFVAHVKATYKNSERLVQWTGDHLFSKPRQDVDVTSGGEKLPTPILTNVIRGDQSGS